jgi:hypothetical protein
MILIQLHDLGYFGYRIRLGQRLGQQLATLLPHL